MPRVVSDPRAAILDHQATHSLHLWMTYKEDNVSPQITRVKGNSGCFTALLGHWACNHFPVSPP